MFISGVHVRHTTHTCGSPMKDVFQHQANGWILLIISFLRDNTPTSIIKLYFSLQPKFREALALSSIFAEEVEKYFRTILCRSLFFQELWNKIRIILFTLVLL